MSTTFFIELVVIALRANNENKSQRKYDLFHQNTKELKCHVVVTSYQTPINDATLLKAVPWTALVVDEGQRLKSEDSLLYKALTSFKIDHKVLLTGIYLA